MVRTRPLHNTVQLLLLVALLWLPSGTSAQTLTRGDSTLELAISEQFSRQRSRALRVWVAHIADSLLQAYGRWPRQRWRISVAPLSARENDPIPWAQVNRGDIDEVEFYVSNDASKAELIANWTSYHELAHLLIPYRGHGDAWFSEGLASYYQNLLPARSGVIDEQTMWQQLHAGFERGQADDQYNGIALHKVSDALRDNGAFMRVYWSGAWYFLAADLQLRQRSKGRQSLDSALDQLNRCCADEPLSAPQIVAKLDAITQTSIFSNLFRKMRESTEAPPHFPLYKALGIVIEGPEVKLAGTAEQRALRAAITAPKSL